MTVEELLAREAIRHTLATYNKCGDANDADGFAACFTEGGSMHSLILHGEGRQAIRAWKAGNKLFSQGKSGATAPFRPPATSNSWMRSTPGCARRGWW